MPELRNAEKPNLRNSQLNAEVILAQQGGDGHVLNVLASCYGMVYKIAHKVAVSVNAVHAMQDIVSAGIVGLYEAIAKYNPNQAGFTTFAYHRIRDACQRDAQRQGAFTAQRPSKMGKRLRERFAQMNIEVVDIDEKTETGQGVDELVGAADPEIARVDNADLLEDLYCRAGLTADEIYALEMDEWELGELDKSAVMNKLRDAAKGLTR